MKSINSVSLLLLLLLLPLQARALSGDREQPIYLEADSVEIDEASGVSVYIGNVVVSQGSMRLEADKMWIHRRQGETEKIVAVGKPVRFRQQMDKSHEEARGHALKITYFIKKDEIYLFDEAVLQQGKDEFSSDRITYLRSRSLVKAGASAQGKQRVRVVIESQKHDQ